jgi:enoyl-CoA hydratase/carnithine racemase
MRSIASSATTVTFAGAPLERVVRSDARIGRDADSVPVNESAILIERRGSALWVTFNRPEVMNALNSDIYAGLIQALVGARIEEAIRAVVITGAGGRAFSAGADLKEVARFDAEGVDPDAEPGLGMGGTQAFATLRAFPKPLIAAVDGYCLAGGMEVAILCDLRAATEQSSFGLPEVRLGLMPDPGLVELSRSIPIGEALQIQLTGRPISAARAHAIGFVQQLAADRVDLVAVVDQMVADLALGAPLATEVFKRVARAGHDLPIEAARRRRNEAWDDIRRTANRVEGPRAFAEGRPPEWNQNGGESSGG